MNYELPPTNNELSMIESVIFDWGGVLIDNPAPPRLRYCAEALAVPQRRLANAISKFIEDFQKGLITEDVFWERVCAGLNAPTPTARSLWADGFKVAYAPRREMFSLAARLHQQGCKTAVLSNAEAPAMQHFLDLRYDMFDVLVFSCAEGVRKPERRIYEIAVERLGSPTDRTIFIDDDPKYTEAAKQAGLNTILFRGIGRLKKELARRQNC
jgi:putative hydrolase of the HAD superfamily